MEGIGLFFAQSRLLIVISCTLYREEIREQQQIAEEIGNAIINIGDPADEEELRNELAAMEQEALDNKMLTAPSAPIASTPQHVGAGKLILVPD